MRVISLLGQKGGTGKSTLALNLAVAASLRGERPILVDLDPQATASSWYTTRENKDIGVLSAFGAHTKLEAILKSASQSGFSIAIVDTPGSCNRASLAATQRSDLCLVPVRPSEADLRATMSTLRSLCRMQCAYAIVLNQAPPRAGHTAP